jgi:ABC-2 type transport system ATP-binding protein
VSIAVADLAIRCRALVKRYPPDVLAVDGLDLEVARGECFGLLGPNGAGKTTTIEILEGLLEPTAGEVEVLGRRWDRDAGALRERLGITLQETHLPEKLTVEEVVRLFRSFYRDGRPVDEVVGLVALEDKRRTWYERLSGGQKQRLAVACALVADPELLFLDEPTTGLDPQSRRQVWDIVKGFKERGRTVVLTTHYMDEAERLCDRIAVVDHGRVIAGGTPRELIRSLGGDHVIEIAVEEGGAGGLRPEELSGLPSVRAVHAEAGHLVLTVAEPHVAIAPLLERVASRGFALASLATRHASLEDVFVWLTGRHLRDD